MFIGRRAELTFPLKLDFNLVHGVVVSACLVLFVVFVFNEYR